MIQRFTAASNQKIFQKKHVNVSSCYASLAVLRMLRNMAPFQLRKQLAESLISSKLDCWRDWNSITCDHALYYVVEPDTILNPVAFRPHNSFTTKTALILVTVAKYILCKISFNQSKILLLEISQSELQSLSKVVGTPTVSRYICLSTIIPSKDLTSPSPAPPFNVGFDVWVSMANTNMLQPRLNIE